VKKYAVEVNNLTVRFGDFAAVKNVSFKVEAGEIFGFLGANGAGKTTTIRVLCGLLVPTEGSVKVGGLGFEHGEHAIKSKVGYMSQRFTLYDDLSVKENLDFAASLRKLPKTAYIKQREELFKLISFDRSIDSKVADLPGGVKQQMSLVCALIHNPEIVFLDEPTAGVSPAAREKFWLLIKKIAGSGKTVFVTTHYMDEAEQCSRIALMKDGELIALDTPEGLKKSAFPLPMYEFEPIQSLSFSEISKMKDHPLFSFFEPYGLRFHVSFDSTKSMEQAKQEFSEKFLIKEIRPSLEDVFISRVEGKG
jgi:ABC-2 type transport system ATP-binding protein